MLLAVEDNPNNLSEETWLTINVQIKKLLWNNKNLEFANHLEKHHLHSINKTLT